MASKVCKSKLSLKTIKVYPHIGNNNLIYIPVTVFKFYTLFEK